MRRTLIPLSYLSILMRSPQLSGRVRNVIGSSNTALHDSTKAAANLLLSSRSRRSSCVLCCGISSQIASQHCSIRRSRSNSHSGGVAAQASPLPSLSCPSYIPLSPPVLAVVDCLDLTTPNLTKKQQQETSVIVLSSRFGPRCSYSQEPGFSDISGPRLDSTGDCKNLVVCSSSPSSCNILEQLVDMTCLSSSSCEAQNEPSVVTSHLSQQGVSKDVMNVLSGTANASQDSSGDGGMKSGRSRQPPRRRRPPPIPPPAPHFILSPYGEHPPPVRTDDLGSVITPYHHATSHTCTSPPALHDEDLSSKPLGTSRPLSELSPEAVESGPTITATHLANISTLRRSAKPATAQEPIFLVTQPCDHDFGGILTPVSAIPEPHFYPLASPNVKVSSSPVSASAWMNRREKFQIHGTSASPPAQSVSSHPYGSYDKRTVDSFFSDVTGFDSRLKLSAENLMRFRDRMRYQRQQSSPRGQQTPSASLSCLSLDRSKSNLCYPLVKKDTIARLYQTLKDRKWPEDILKEIMAESEENFASLELPTVRRRTSNFRLEAAAQLKPHPLKAHSGGEDYYFIRSCTLPRAQRFLILQHSCTQPHL
eukprot:GHVQ01004482.1.p1 GENE.GHVQ01004482.1~~GHVQ01004482.1.p1  ORF type:complete len:593 (+),score=61.80 GHVQ01004482.1:465-2243(+)